MFKGRRRNCRRPFVGPRPSFLVLVDWPFEARVGHGIEEMVVGQVMDDQIGEYRFGRADDSGPAAPSRECRRAQRQLTPGKRRVVRLLERVEGPDAVSFA